MPFDPARLAALRERAVLTQKELAARAGVSQLAVHNIESGKSEPRPATIRKIARALGVKPQELLEPD